MKNTPTNFSAAGLASYRASNSPAVTATASPDRTHSQRSGDTYFFNYLTLKSGDST